jgi:hypothetical protein
MFWRPTSAYGDLLPGLAALVRGATPGVTPLDPATDAVSGPAPGGVPDT